MSEDLVNRAASESKNLLVIEGANHMELYDGQNYVGEAVAALVPFFDKYMS